MEIKKIHVQSCTQRCRKQHSKQSSLRMSHSAYALLSSFPSKIGFAESVPENTAPRFLFAQFDLQFPDLGLTRDEYMVVLKESMEVSDGKSPNANCAAAAAAALLLSSQLEASRGNGLRRKTSAV